MRSDEARQALERLAAGRACYMTRQDWLYEKASAWKPLFLVGVRVQEGTFALGEGATWEDAVSELAGKLA